MLFYWDFDIEIFGIKIDNIYEYIKNIDLIFELGQIVYFGFIGGIGGVCNLYYVKLIFVGVFLEDFKDFIESICEFFQNVFFFGVDVSDFMIMFSLVEEFF